MDPELVAKFLVLHSLLRCSLLQAQTSVSILEQLASLAKVNVTKEPFQNWAQTVQKSDVYVTKPATTDDIINIIKAAQNMKLKIRVMGAATSWSQLFPDENQILMDMNEYARHLTRITMEYPTTERRYFEVTAMSNVRIKELSDYLEGIGLDLPSSVTYNNPTIAGIIATASHGYQVGDSGLSGHMTKVSLVTGKGEEREFNETSSEVMKAIRANLGLCGVITKVTFKVAPWTISKRITNIKFPLKSFFDGNGVKLHYLLDGAYAWHATWRPQFQKSPEEITKNLIKCNATLCVMEDDLDLTLVYPQGAGTPPIVQAVHNATFFPESVVLPGGESSNGEVQYGLVPSLLSWEDIFSPNYTSGTTYETEFAIGDDLSSFQYSREALEVISSELVDWFDAEGSIPVESIKFGWWSHPDDGCYLCHSSVADLTRNNITFAFNFVSNYVYAAQAKHMITKIFNRLKSSGITVLPHFGTIHTFLPDIESHISSVLENPIKDFLQIKKDYNLDPDDLFVNTYLKSLGLNQNTVSPTV